MQGAPPPSPPELPEGVDRRPRWPAWYGPVGFLVAFTATAIAFVILAVAFGVESEEDQSAAFLTTTTLFQDAFLIGTALLFAARVTRPTPWHFGLNGTKFWPAVGWTALAVFAFYTLSAVYSVIVGPDTDQGITEDLGADESTIGLISAGLMVVALAPLAEEFFFRGFFYRALRSRYSIAAAVTIDALVFGAIHWPAGGIEVVPPLAILGAIFCLLYERTGSLFPCIALHAFNNALAYGVLTDGDGAAVSAVVGTLMLAGCALVPRVLRSAPVAA
jgi:uncharacterized protein